LAALVVIVVSLAGWAGGCIAVESIAQNAFFRNLAENRATFLASLGDTTVTVFPVVVRRSTLTYDEAGAVTLAEFLNSSGLARATVVGRQVPISGGWHMNQARMWRESAASFGEFVRANPIGTRYALLAEYLGGPKEVGGIHVYVVDAQGAVAFQVLLNSHWKEFSRANPKTESDCTAVVIDVLRDRLKKSSGATP
jgi:hypothetical protein